MANILALVPMNAANFDSGAATDGQVLTADGSGGSAFEAVPADSDWSVHEDGGRHTPTSTAEGANAFAAGIGNIASGLCATVGGGKSNIASSYCSTVGGGRYNGASFVDATVGGGRNNTASGNCATVGGGRYNTASGDCATVGGGYYNTASGNWATVGGGGYNTASGVNATVGGGRYNTASGVNATVGGGGYNTASGVNATVGGGRYNTASGNYSTVSGGVNALADKHGQQAHSAGNFRLGGRAQTSVLVVRKETNNATPAELFLDGDSVRCTIAADTTWAFNILVVARRTDADNESAAYQFLGCIDNNAGTTALVGSLVKTVIAEDTAGWDCNVTADDTNDALIITATGEADKTIQWVARIELVETTG